MKYVCGVCGYIHDEEKDGKWESLPDDWKCPICGADKSVFQLLEESNNIEKNKKDETEKYLEEPHFDIELSAIEMSIICSNLARGCEKQYLFEQSDAFKNLSKFFSSKSKIFEEQKLENLISLVEKDLSSSFPYAKEVSINAKDRGALRALTWSEKVTRMLSSILERYKNEGEKMLENTGIYVCSVCGFIYIGDNPPSFCPVCKVPSWKFEKIEGRAK